MIGENDEMARARVAAVLHLWGVKRVADRMIRDIIQTLNEHAVDADRSPCATPCLAHEETPE